MTKPFLFQLLFQALDIFILIFIRYLEIVHVTESKTVFHPSDFERLTESKCTLYVIYDVHFTLRLTKVIIDSSCIVSFSIVARAKNAWILSLFPFQTNVLLQKRDFKVFTFLFQG